MASCSATTGSSTTSRRFQPSDAEATCCSTTRNASSGPPRMKRRATTAGGRAVTASIDADGEADAAPAELADPEGGDVERGVDPLQPGGELLGDAEHPGHPLAQGPAEGPDDLAERLHRQHAVAPAPSRPGRRVRRAAAARRASGRANQRTSESSRVAPAHRASPHATASRAPLTAGSARSVNEDPLLLGQAQEPARPQPAGDDHADGEHRRQLPEGRAVGGPGVADR